MSDQRIRVGIDVGGTFTKAVAMDDATHEIVHRATTKTTHDATEGVALGVVRVFTECLEAGGIAPDEVTFIAHSTTQATNSMLEGDVAKVGVLGLAGGLFQGFIAKRQTRLPPLEIAPGKHIPTAHAFVDTRGDASAKLTAAIAELRAEGAEVLVASKAFGVDEGADETEAVRIAEQQGLRATAAHEISELYGLSTRTQTAVINASVLPKMMEVAELTQRSVQEAGVTTPLMIMRGDGGAMNAEEMQRRPLLTMVSGPSASVAGALMYLRVSNGVFFEVGGTTTNITVIRDGKPTVTFAEIGGHRTFVKSLDVRLLGVAGGSMVRVDGGSIVDVGPRSAHIAGLDYASFADPATIVDPEVELVRPREGDPADYVAVRSTTGNRYAITTTCAANVLGVASDEWYAHGDGEAAQRALAPLAALVGLDVRETAELILDVATDKTTAMVERLITEYGLDREQLVLVGGGGGAAALLPHTARRMSLDFEIPENAEVISSIGVALAMVQDSVERMIPNPTPEDMVAIRREAQAKAIATGADPDSLEVYVEVDAVNQRVRAVARGAVEMASGSRGQEVDDAEAARLAATSLKVDVDAVEPEAGTSGLRVFSTRYAGRGRRSADQRAVRVVDARGLVRLQARDAQVTRSTSGGVHDAIAKLWDSNLGFSGDSVIAPDVYLLNGAQLLDLSGMVDVAHVQAVVQSELTGLEDDHGVVVVAVRKA